MMLAFTSCSGTEPNSEGVFLIISSEDEAISSNADHADMEFLVENTQSNQAVLYKENILLAYEDFLNGKIGTETKGGFIKIGDIWLVSEVNKSRQYALCDMNGDGIPELLVSAINTYIFTCNNGELSLWWSDEYWNDYSKILENKDIIHIRHGVAPTHITYHYLILDEYGGEKEHIIFEKYDSDEDGIYDFYVYENIDDLAQEEWDQETQPYLSVKEIEWEEYSDSESFSKKKSNTSPIDDDAFNCRMEDGIEVQYFSFNDTQTKVIGNPRFDFWLTIPTEWKAYDRSHNGDGYYIDCENKNIDMRVYGEYSPLPEDFYIKSNDDDSTVTEFVFDSGINGWQITKVNHFTKFLYKSNGRYITFYLQYENDPTWFDESQEKILLIARTLRDGEH